MNKNYEGIFMSLNVTTINVNGIRAATRVRSEENRGFLEWLNNSDSDIVCLQEVRATEDQTVKALSSVLQQTGEGEWFLHMQESNQKGRAGVAILSRREPLAVRTGFGVEEFAESGRYIEADFDVADLLGDGVDTGLVTVAPSTSHRGRRTLRARTKSIVSWRGSKSFFLSVPMMWPRRKPRRQLCAATGILRTGKRT